MSSSSTGTSQPNFATRQDDLVAGICAVWMVSGLFVDGWAHRNNKPETFFTPWHGLLYSGFIASVVWMLRVVRSHQRPGLTFRGAIPTGYGVRLIGVILFGAGAIGDLIWHEVFGIEVNIEALLSPTHLILLSGGLLMAIGPIVATLTREGDHQQARWSSTGPVIVSVTFMMSVIQFFLMYGSPYDDFNYSKEATNYYGSIDFGGVYQRFLVSGIAAMILFSIVLAVALTFVVRNVEIPRGALTVLILVPAFLQTVLNSFRSIYLLLGPVLAALLAEVTWPAVKRRWKEQQATLPLWIGAITLVLGYGVMGAVAWHDGIGWAVHLWTGVPVLSALLCTLITAAQSTTRARLSD